MATRAYQRSSVYHQRPNDMSTGGKAPDIASLKATLGGVGAGFVGDGARGLGSISSTLVGVAGLASPALRPVEMDETLGADDAGPSSHAATSATVGGVGRTTVLPRRRKAAPVDAVAVDQRPRFDRMRLLGQGAMGSVELARDNDIRRTVAVKRMLPGVGGDAAALRFADEVRIVGQLEHPGIVPVYDVGRDDSGDVYLVMKHLEGETMEAALHELRAGNVAYRGRFTIEQRVNVFLGVLDAVRYAHARGILHRDLKPANIMIGQYGEVTVMDWGIAKPIRDRSGSAGVQPLDRTLSESQDQRLLETQLGALAGSPLYMSPEQAAGRNDDLDERSDVYTLSVVLCEWLTLEHPLADKTTVTEVLAAIISNDPDGDHLSGLAMRAAVPMEYMHVILRGLTRERDGRFQSVEEMENALKRIQDGNIIVRCHVTLAKSAANSFTHWIDRNVMLYTALLGLTALTLVGGLGYGLYRIVRALIG